MFGLHYRHLVAWALAILLTLGGAATSVAAPPADRGSAGAPVFVEEPVRQRLLGRVGNRMPGRERMRVMVSIDSADEPDVHLRGWQFRNPVARSARQRAIASLQDRVLHGLGARQGRMLHRFRHVPYISLDIDAAELEILEATPGVVSIREDTLMRPFLNDSAPQLDAPHAWSLGAAGAGQAVAVLDTGVDTSHPAFVGRVIAEACFSTTDGVGGTSLCPNGEEPDGRDWQIGTGAGVNCTGVSSCDHGTHVAGIAASADAQYTGIAPDARLVAIQVFAKVQDAQFCGSSSPCLGASASDIVRALEHVYELTNDFPVASVNLSLGSSTTFSSQDACDAARPYLRM